MDKYLKIIFSSGNFFICSYDHILMNRINIISQVQYDIAIYISMLYVVSKTSYYFYFPYNVKNRVNYNGSLQYYYSYHVKVPHTSTY